ncbi:MAG: cytochrome c biogenesis protein CcsA, partial [Gammaproteobacteria bacterium]
MPILLISLITITFYTVTGILLAWRLFGRKTSASDNPLLAKPGLIVLGLIAVTLHGYILYKNLFTVAGLNIGFFYAGSLVTWLMSLTLLLAAISNPVENLGVFLFPFTAVTILLSRLFPIDHILLANQAIEIKLHILLSILAYSLISIAAIHAVLLAVQERQLRARHPGGFIRALPPVQSMESLLFQMIGLGFFLLSLSLITGVIYLENMFEQRVAHHTILSIIAWFVFAILLWGRWKFGW